jgi:hypothetical protein
MARKILVASDEATKYNIKQKIRQINYIMKSYAKSFISYCRKCAKDVFNIKVLGKYSQKKDLKIMKSLSKCCRE